MGLKVSSYTLRLASQYAGPRLAVDRLSRSGALISDGVGVADLHPWPELGEASLSEEIEALKKGQPLRLGQIALEFLQIDSKLRKEKRNAFDGRAGIPAHCLLPPGAPSDDFKTHGASFFKFKVSASSLAASEAQIKAWVKHLAPSARLRLDYNFGLTQEQYLMHLARIDSVIDQIQFFEDPFEFDESLWWQTSFDQAVALAFDRGSLSQKTYVGARDDLGTASHLYVVTKPLCEDSFALASFAANSMRRLVLTSSLGHPIGQAQAAYAFYEIQKRHPLVLEDTGLASHICYENNAFAECFGFEKGQFQIANSGYGWGFDQALKQLKWVEL
jgi:O-succinylbenzoate synthase